MKKFNIHMHQYIMHSQLGKNGAVLMATDITQAEGVKPGNDMAVSVNFDIEEEIRAAMKFKLNLATFLALWASGTSLF